MHFSLQTINSQYLQCQSVIGQSVRVQIEGRQCESACDFTSARNVNPARREFKKSHANPPVNSPRRIRAHMFIMPVWQARSNKTPWSCMEV